MEEFVMSKTLKGKKIVNFGDSIFGNFHAPEDISSFIAKKTGATVYNVGFGGCRMSEHSLPQFDRFCMYRIAHSVTTRDFSLQDESFSYEPIGEALPAYFGGNLELLKSIDLSTVDIATIAYGTNDFTAGQRIEGDDKYDITTYAGALRYSIETIKKVYPNLILVLCSQTYRFWRNADGSFSSHSHDRIINDQTLPEFCKKTEEIAKEYGLLYIDNYNGSGINESTRGECFSATDGTHPIAHGRELIAESISRALLENYGE